MTIPTILTLLRIALIPVFVAVFYLPVSWANLAPAAWFAVPAVSIIGREIAVSALREWMADLGSRARVAVSVLCKYKTAAQMVALVLLLYRDPFAGLPVMTMGLALLFLAAGLTLWSMEVYLRAAWPMLMSRGNY